MFKVAFVVQLLSVTMWSTNVVVVVVVIVLCCLLGLLVLKLNAYTEKSAHQKKKRKFTENYLRMLCLQAKCSNSICVLLLLLLLSVMSLLIGFEQTCLVAADNRG